MNESNIRALFMIASQGRPPFTNPDVSCAECREFVDKCTIIDADARPSTTDLMTHPFLKMAGNPMELVPLVEIARAEAAKQTIDNLEEYLTGGGDEDGGGDYY